MRLRADKPIPPHLWGGAKRRVRRPRPGQWEERFWRDRAEEARTLAETEEVPAELKRTLMFVAAGCESIAASLGALDETL